jgi:threonine synthase
VVYDYDSIELDKKSFQDRPKTVWRYFELLPICDKKNIVDLGAGYTILHRCTGLAKALGLRTLYVKDDTVNPTYSFKDRPSTVAVSKALEFGAKAVGCASTGNLAAAVAAHAAKAGLPCYVFVPADIELNKIVQASTYGARIVAVKGTYDDANRLAAQAAEAYDWAFANINIRPYYVEGSKTLAFEVCEQLGWERPDHVIVPVASGALLCAIWRGFKEFEQLDLIDDTQVKVTGAQPSGCAPVVSAFKSNTLDIDPIEYPDTIAKSLAVGDPGDGAYAVKTIRESGGVAESATDAEILDAIELLAKTEGIFAEPAGGVTVAVLKKLVESGEISPDEKVVCYVTGNGLKATETILHNISKPVEIEPKLESLAKIIS